MTTELDTPQDVPARPDRASSGMSSSTGSARAGSDRVRVLFAIPSLDRGGPDRVFFDLMRSFDRERFEVSLAVSAREGFYLDRLPKDVRVQTIGDDRGLYGRYPVFHLAKAVWSLRPHVVIATLRSLNTAGFARPLFPAGTRLVLRLANHLSANTAELQAAAPLKHKLTYQLKKRALVAADHIVCQSREMETDVKAIIGDKVPMSVIGNPIDLDFVRKRSAEYVPSLTGSPALLTVGRLMRQKGVDVLLRAFARIHAVQPEAHLTVVGDGPDRAGLEALARDLGLEDAVTFAGFVSNPYPLMAKAALFVLASRYEGFPNVVIEALACGTAVVATDCPGANRDILFASEGGFLAPMEDPEGLANTVGRALEAGPLDRAGISAKCAERHDLSRVTAAYQDCIAG